MHRVLTLDTTNYEGLKLITLSDNCLVGAYPYLIKKSSHAVTRVYQMCNIAPEKKYFWINYSHYRIVKFCQ